MTAVMGSGIKGSSGDKDRINQPTCLFNEQKSRKIEQYTAPAVCLYILENLILGMTRRGRSEFNRLHHPYTSLRHLHARYFEFIHKVQSNFATDSYQKDTLFNQQCSCNASLASVSRLCFPPFVVPCCSSASCGQITQGQGARVLLGLQKKTMEKNSKPHLCFLLSSKSIMLCSLSKEIHFARNTRSSVSGFWTARSRVCSIAFSPT